MTSLSLFSKWSGQWEHAVCAGTDSSGVFVREIGSPGSQWVNVGLAGKKITAVFVYHSGVGPMDFDTIIAGTQPDKAPGDSTLLYSYPYGFDSTWAPCDIWLDTDSMDCVQAICGYAYSGHLPPLPLFIGDGAALFRSYLVEVGGYWEKVWSLNGNARIDVIHIAKEWPCCSPLWAGGETGNSDPFLIRSLDKGDTWEIFSPDFGVENICYSITSHPDYPDTVYAGMRDAILKTIDGGNTWSVTHHYGNPISYYGVAVDPSNPEHVFAGGTVSENSFALYQSYDGGDTWMKILPEKIPESEVAGITCMIADTLNEHCVVYLGTSGSGVFLYRSEMLDVDESEGSNIPDEFSLSQNYPNPFNATTDIRYQIVDSGSLTTIALKIYTILGQEVRTLMNEYKEAGFFSITWDGKDARGWDVPSGIYFYQLLVNDGQLSETRKMVLLR